MKKIARVCWNSNDWIRPSGRVGKSKNRGSYEFLNGYGHEEWLLDTNKIIDGYHYGYLQAIGKHRDKYLNSVFDVSLYSINSENKQRWWLGEIQNVEVVSEAESKRVYKIYKEKGWYSQMLSQLRQVGANVDEFKKFVTPDIFAVVRFKPIDMKLYEEPVEFKAGDPAVTSDYYNLKNMKHEPQLDLDFSFSFRSGHNAGPGKTKRSYRGGGNDVSLLHNELQTDLYEELVEVHGKDSVGTEIKCGFGNRVDVVVKTNQKFIFYEIKTLRTAKSCIREALGQLLEYAYYGNNLKIEKLIVASPCPINKDDKQYLKRLGEKFNLNIGYHQIELEKK